MIPGMRLTRYSLVAGLLLHACAGAAQELAGISEDELDTDEAGLWMVVEKQEQDIRTSSVNLDDPELTGHINAILCDLVGDNACSFLRPYVVRAPGFNAFVMPNGAFFLQSGLLLRVGNDSELAAVIGHEASHYFRRHTLRQMRGAYRTNNTVALIGAVISAATQANARSAESIHELARAHELSNTAMGMLNAGVLLARLQLLGFSREMETEADLDGVTWMSRASYDATASLASYDPAAPLASYDATASLALWEAVIAEQAAGGAEAGFSLLSTHPAPQARIDALSEQVSAAAAAQTAAPGQPATLDDGGAGIAALVDPYRDEWLADEMSALHPDQFSHLLGSQVERGYPGDEAAYLEGMSYANKAKRDESDRRREYHDRAVRAFGHSIAAGGADARPEIHRELGELHESLGNLPEAREAYGRYLELAPEAWDARFIRRKL